MQISQEAKGYWNWALVDQEDDDESLAFQMNSPQTPQYEDGFDLILGSDLIYDFEHFKELAETLDSVYIKNKNEIIFCYTHRFSDVEKWFQEEVSKKGFKVEYAKDEEFDEDYYEKGKVFIIRIFKE
eukprot:403376424